MDSAAQGGDTSQDDGAAPARDQRLPREAYGQAHSNPAPGYSSAYPPPNPYPSYPAYSAYPPYPPYPPQSGQAGSSAPPYPPPVWPQPSYPPAYPPAVYPGAGLQRPVYPEFPPSEPSGTQLVRSDPGASVAGRPEAAGCASGAALLAVLSKIAIAGKFLLPFVSALASLAAYALLFGWQFGAGILVLLLVHEMGHYVVLRAKGIPASLPVFIPLLGAYVAMRRMPPSVRDEAEIAVAGPFVGALAGAVCFSLYQVTHVSLFLPLAWFSFFLNLLNLIPVSPLDGGRIVAAISRWIWPLGLAVVIIAFFYTGSILLLILAWLGLLQTIQRFRLSPAMGSYYHVPFLSRAYVTILYFGLAGALAIGMVASQQLMQQLGARPF